MTDRQDTDWTRTRIAMTLVGMAGGAACYALVDILPDLVRNERVLMFVSIVVVGFFHVLLAMTGPVSLARAALPSLGWATGVAGLFLWASFRFDKLGPFVDSGHPIAAALMLYLVGTPFLTVILIDGPRGWRDYAALFQTAWTVLVRFAAAGLFTGLVWGVLFLSNALLELVGIDLIERILELDPVPFLITGGVFGLALAVAHEWRDYVSPHLLLRLLRLLVPLVVPVLALFLIAVLLSGMDEVLFLFSETAMLTGVAIGAITLVTVSVDRDEAHQVQARLMRGAVRALAVMLLPLAALAVWGIAQRVMQYGWTPDRVLAGLCAGMVALYGVAYSASALWRGDFGGRIRAINIRLALLSLALAALWLTPVLNAERISAGSQLARIVEGRVSPDAAPIWELAKRWGQPGRAAIYELRQRDGYPQREEVVKLAAAAEAADSRSDFIDTENGETPQDRAGKLAALLPLRPEGTELPAKALEGLSDWHLREALDACRRSFDDGRPGCVYLEVTFNPARQGRQGVLLLRQSDNRASAWGTLIGDSGMERTGELMDLAQDRWPRLDASIITQIMDGAYSIAPAGLNALNIGGMSLFPDN